MSYNSLALTDKNNPTHYQRIAIRLVRIYNEKFNINHNAFSFF